MLIRTFTSTCQAVSSSKEDLALFLALTAEGLTINFEKKLRDMCEPKIVVLSPVPMNHLLQTQPETKFCCQFRRDEGKERSEVQSLFHK